MLKRRRAGAVLLLPALLWIFTQLVMSGFALAPSAARADGLRMITLCTGTELTTITIDADGNPVKDVPAKKVSCPWGARFAGVGPIPAPDLMQLSVPCTRAAPLAIVMVRQAAPRGSCNPCASRTPPLSTRL